MVGGLDLLLDESETSRRRVQRLAEDDWPWYGPGRARPGPPWREGPSLDRERQTEVRRTEVGDRGQVYPWRVPGEGTRAEGTRGGYPCRGYPCRVPSSRPPGLDSGTRRVPVLDTPATLRVPNN